MILIIGGGPAGMMAAISASTGRDKVTLIEKNDRLGSKLLLTGGGRCNLTNMRSAENMIAGFSGTGKFLRDAFKQFGAAELTGFFERLGLKVRVEEDGKVFPVTDKASSVLEVLKEEVGRRGTRVLLNTRVKDILVAGGSVGGALCSDGTVIKADKVVVATGGVSYGSTGSTGDGIRMAEKTGHTVVPLRPGLTALPLEGGLPGRLEGVALDGVRLVFRSGKKRVVSGTGSVIFTKDGISGPLVFSSESRAVDWICEGAKVALELDMVPGTGEKAVRAELTSGRPGVPPKNVRNVLKAFMPARMADELLKLSGVPPDRRTNRITSEESRRLAAWVKGLRFDVAGTVPIEKAQVTRGGVSVREIDPRTMGSRKVKGLYFAGEMIDVDGGCGGFNLQAAFSTGYLAGISSSSG